MTYRHVRPCRQEFEDSRALRRIAAASAELGAQLREALEFRDALLFDGRNAGHAIKLVRMLAEEIQELRAMRRAILRPDSAEPRPVQFVLARNARLWA